MATPLDLIEGLKERVEQILAAYPAQYFGSTQKPFNIFRHKVPERMANRVKVKGQEETQDDVFPFCVVKTDSGGKERNVSNHDISMQLFVGVENEGLEGEGYDDVLRCLTRIWNELNQELVVAKFFKLKDELDWSVNTDDAETHPYYYGLIRLTFETPSIQYTGGFESGERTN